YLLLGLLWCYLYAIREHFSPNSFAGLGPSKVLYVTDLVFFSFGALTTAGGGASSPRERWCRRWCSWKKWLAHCTWGLSSRDWWRCMRAHVQALTAGRYDGSRHWRRSGLSVTHADPCSDSLALACVHAH